ncbi:hypothetical protein Hanom_Chr03g00232311 [Helianthus anomalus]
MTIRLDDNSIGWPFDPNAHDLFVLIFKDDVSSDWMTIRSSVLCRTRASDWHPAHNIYCILDESYANMTPFKDMAKFLRESKIAKALTDRTKVYESHVRMFWKSVRY